jgi:hypothetical protein
MALIAGYTTARRHIGTPPSRPPEAPRPPPADFVPSHIDGHTNIVRDPNPPTHIPPRPTRPRPPPKKLVNQKPPSLASHEHTRPRDNRKAGSTPRTITKTTKRLKPQQPTPKKSISQDHNHPHPRSPLTHRQHVTTQSNRPTHLPTPHSPDQVVAIQASNSSPDCPR